MVSFDEQVAIDRQVAAIGDGARAACGAIAAEVGRADRLAAFAVGDDADFRDIEGQRRAAIDE